MGKHLIHLKQILTYPLILLLLFSCSEDRQNVSIQIEQEFPQPQIIQLNTDEGYDVNQLNGDSLFDLINSMGDTIVTGKPVLVKGVLIDEENLIPPNVVKAKDATRIAVIRNESIVPSHIEAYQINMDSLVIRTPGVYSSSEIIINSIGDTVLTNEYILSVGKIRPALQPHPEFAKQARFKDASFNNLQYMDVEQGLNSSYVLKLYIDSRGNIWSATSGGGVSKYDGENFIHYTKEQGLPTNNVWSILEDKKGDMWFGTYQGGLCKYDGENFIIYDESQGLTNNSIVTLCEDYKGNIWFGTSGGGMSVYDGKGFKHFTVKEGLSSNYIRKIIEDKEGNIWIATNKGVNKYDGIRFTHFTKKDGLLSNSIYSILEDREGNIWFGSKKGAIKFDGFTFTHFTKKEGLLNEYIRDIVEDKKGNLWFATYGGGVNKFDGEKFIYISESEGLSNNKVRCIIEDESYNLWFGTYGGGISIYNDKSFTHFTKKDGLTKNVRSILEDTRGNLWYGTSGGGVIKLKNDSISYITKNEGLSHNKVYSIFEDSKRNVWFGTYGGGVNKYNGKSITHYTKKSGLPSNIVLSIMEDKNGNIWFGTDGGICKYDGENFTHYTEKEGLYANSVFKILNDREGNIWFASIGGGVTKFDGEYFTHFTEKEGLSNNNVYTLFEDHAGNIWLGSYGGVSMFDGENFTHYTEKEGLSNNTVWSILEDKEENIWVSTERGLSLIISNKKDNSEKTSTTIITYLEQDGLKGVDFFANSAIIDSKNRAWWGSGKSLSTLDLNDFTLPRNSPEILLNYIELNEQFIDYHNLNKDEINGIEYDYAEPFFNYPQNLELAYYNDHLTFHFSAIDWSAPHKIRYSHKIEGLNNEWSKASNESKVDYRNLPYGKYVFKVRSIRESQQWSDTFEYKFTINPPWWLTWWAKVGYFVFALILIRTFVSWRTSKLKRDQEVLKTKVENATSELREKNIVIERRSEEVEKQKDIIEVAHKEITDSIAYAKRIQGAILPPTSIVRKYLKDSFIIYKPKDVVAGDFFWMRQHDGKTLVAAADCTGHGVPGAMVSVVCNNALNRSVREYGITDPGKILDKTREVVIREFEKSEEEVNDGMDIALFVLDGMNLQYAGAHNPLWILRDGKIIQLKGDRQPIGRHRNELPFTTHSFDLQKDDLIYIFTDGFVDQFGGERGKKFKSGGLQTLLLNYSDKSIGEQRMHIDKAFEDWKGDLEQVDDVCIIGLRV